MKVKYSTIVRIIIYFTAFLMLGYVYLFDPILIAGYPRRIIVATVSILLALFCMSFRGNLHQGWKYSQVARRYLICYIPCILIALLIAGIQYQYSVWNYLVAVAPFCYIFLTFPLLALFVIDNSLDKVLKRIALIEIVILIFKFIAWFSSNFTGTVFFPNILKEYSGWTVSGMARVEGGALFALVFIYFFVNFIQKKKIIFGLGSGILLLFMMFITQFRFQLLSLLVTGYVVLYVDETKNKKIVFVKRMLLILILILIGIYVLPEFVSSFNIGSMRGNSTKTRLIEIGYFAQLMKNRSAFLGLGIFDENNPVVSSLITYLGQTMYISDLGIIGAFFTFGIMIFPIYGYLFYVAIKTYRNSKNKIPDYDRSILVGVIAYMIVSNMALNIFDAQRAYAVPFYLSIIAYESYKIRIFNNNV